jgi:hypothetical protein
MENAIEASQTASEEHMTILVKSTDWGLPNGWSLITMRITSAIPVETPDPQRAARGYAATVRILRARCDPLKSKSSTGGLAEEPWLSSRLSDSPRIECMLLDIPEIWKVGDTHRR